MLVLVCYDVNTETKSGQRRLRRVARLCEAKGQRVQKSVFECELTLMQLDALEQSLLSVIDTAADQLRLYRIPSSAEVRVHGRDNSVDFQQPLVL